MVQRPHAEVAEFLSELRDCVRRKSLADSAIRCDRGGVWHPAALRDPGDLALRSLRMVFHWRNPGSGIRPPIFTAIIAFVPALICRLFLDGSLDKSWPHLRSSQSSAADGCSTGVRLKWRDEADLSHGASSGIGLAIAHALLARGDEVWGTSRNRNDFPRCRNYIQYASTWTIRILLGGIQRCTRGRWSFRRVDQQCRERTFWSGRVSFQGNNRKPVSDSCFRAGSFDAARFAHHANPRGRFDR